MKPHPATSLRLVPLYLGDRAELLSPLAAQLSETFGVPVETRAPGFDPELAFDRSRGQYNSTILLAQLLDESHEAAGRVLGVTSVDLFIPVLTYVFGEAQLDGRAAMISTFRLRSEIYGLPASPALLLDRSIKEAIHELGHTFGLLHCQAPECVMRSSTYVEDIDLKSDHFCPRCRAQL
ncbi:MAG: archaemetzincin family Zn-dependent metalloprotease [bacterium]